jgi:hypothetical protein
MTTVEPTLLFFRHRPAGWAVSPYLASSLQSVETSFFLIALGRYPHALMACASALETCLQAAKIGASDRDGLNDLIIKAKRSSAAVAQFSMDLLTRFREARNRITHRGFGAGDDSESVALYLDAGLPLLRLCYREFHAFDFDDGLLMEYAEHLRVAKEVHEYASKTPDGDLCYCLSSFAHLIRWCFKGSFSSQWELQALTTAEEIGVKFERTYKRAQELEGLFEVSWTFDCPVCSEFEGVIAELESDSLDAQELCLGRMACTHCDFVVTDSHVHLSNSLLAAQLAEVRGKILQEYGIE